LSFHKSVIDGQSADAPIDHHRRLASLARQGAKEREKSTMSVAYFVATKTAPMAFSAESELRWWGLP
jgi:hypothetical protein